jgi:CheY-like chemotaxis protein
VLLVDDDPLFREAACAVLLHAGYEVQAAGHGLEALRWLEAAAVLPDAILLDLDQPVMDGRRFVQEQRLRPALAAIPVALVSGSRELARIAAELAVEAYLEKPVELDALVALVARLVGRAAADVTARRSTCSSCSSGPRCSSRRSDTC